MNTEILSTGIDIGTSTTSIVVSRLIIADTAARFTVPRITIINKKILYKSAIYPTPLMNESMIDIAKVKSLVANEYKKANIRADMIQTGAVIITGESARKENAEIATRELGEFAGDFVVAAAGPDLEAIIAGKGSGAEKHSAEHHCVTANLDIGGGTTNIAIFDNGKVVAYSSMDIGGKLLTYDEAHRINYVSPRLKQLCDQLRINLRPGMEVDQMLMNLLTREMARVLDLALDPNAPLDLVEMMRSAGSSKLPFPILKKGIDCISFSGGVAECFYSNETDPYRYGDIGVSLASSIRESGIIHGKKLMMPAETIRATVVGAGSYTTSISGSTILYTRELFPMKNIPVMVVEEEMESECLKGNFVNLRESVRWFLEQSKAENIAFSFKGRKTITYDQLCQMAESIVAVAQTQISQDKPLLVLVENDLAKSLGQALYRKLFEKRDVICIDSVKVRQGDYVDLGKPLMNGMVIPLVIKTLVYC